MDRRTYLGAAAGTVGTLAAGCLGRGAQETSLGEPEDQGADSEDLPYPAYGEEFPESTLPDALSGEEVSTADFEDDRVVVMTFIYTHCPDGVCPALTQVLRHAQADAVEKEYTGDVAFLATTFDPERDTADVLREFGDEQGVDYEAGGWHFLRPESEERAREVVTDTYGVEYERIDPSEMQGDHSGHDMGEYGFDHYPITYLVNREGYVERAYTGVPGTSRVVEDLGTVTGN
ncbi:SCO family protein [Halalkalicoccus jeotgali]|uniref:Electron transport protein SCO1/SenC n=1 Tax=Halalkalicoccus jeotgali (strain DSM 18796 / CECT 7217 / JCM 14584 / KCTC 4019 / B3) TaxID=795797 RepID=D8J866_HALJB|nr:SCO family protein [Halalkalicoccus jeotgali]ADJ14179.1 electron transport protein SCO1/SenC [Halalkalicoccus jeotgali B3]ELY34639.1 electron transport protein SCO1/SenC [Halalkalicoccus jeotgali B3]